MEKRKVVARSKRARRVSAKKNGKTSIIGRLFLLNKYQFATLLLVFFIAGNMTLQIIQKPTEILSFFLGHQTKNPKQTWESYSDILYRQATTTIPATYLAALAQAESGGDPYSSPPWKLDLKKSWKQIFAPASSSVGLYQFTSGTFKAAKKYCIHNNKLARSTVWSDINGCWFNSLYFRFSASDSIELASAYLTNYVQRLLGKKRTSLRNRKRLASIIHLCGVRIGKKFVRNNFKLKRIRKCGTHSVSRYVRRIENLERKFKILARNS